MGQRTAALLPAVKRGEPRANNLFLRMNKLKEGKGGISCASFLFFRPQGLFPLCRGVKGLPMKRWIFFIPVLALTLWASPFLLGAQPAVLMAPASSINGSSKEEEVFAPYLSGEAVLSYFNLTSDLGFPQYQGALGVFGTY